MGETRPASLIPELTPAHMIPLLRHYKSLRAAEYIIAKALLEHLVENDLLSTNVESSARVPKRETKRVATLQL